MTGGWYAAQQDLSNHAHSVIHRFSGSMHPGFRGDNDVIAARDGEVWRKKPFNPGTLILSMWAVGSESDGSMPEDPDRQKVCIDHLHELSRIFGQRSLVEIARTEDQRQYGLRNLVRNPSMENAFGKVVERENVLENPNAEYSDSTIVTRRNLIGNPSMEDGGHEFRFRENLVRNPRMSYEGNPTVMRTNLCPNPSVEGTILTWRAGGNAKISRVRVAVPGVWPIAGERSLRVEAVTAAAAAGVCGPIRVKASTAYVFSAYVRNPNAASRSFRIEVNWKNRTGGVVGSQLVGSTTAVAAGQVLRPSATATSPAGAHTAHVRLVSTNPGAGDFCQWDAVLVETGTTVQTYFDGATTEMDGLRHRWTKQVGLSPAEEYRVVARGWRAGVNLISMLTTAESVIGTRALKVHATATLSSGQVVLTQRPEARGPVGEGKVVSGRIQLQAITGQTLTVSASLAAYDSDGVELAELGTVTANLDEAWSIAEIDGATTPTNTVAVGWKLESGAAWTTGQGFYADAALIETARAVGDYFDGATPEDDVFDYEWDGDPHWSTSSMTGFKVESFEAVNGRMYRVADGTTRRYAMRIEAYRNPVSTEQPAVIATPERFWDGRTHTWSIWVRHNRAVNVRCRAVWGDLTISTGSTVLLVANTWTRISVTGTAPADVDETPQLYAETTSTPADGDQFDLEAALFEPVGDLRAYFDGESGDRTAWLDEKDQSESQMVRDRAEGWVGYGSSFPRLHRLAGGSTLTGGESFCLNAVASQAGNCGVTSGADQVDAALTYAWGIDVRVDNTRDVTVGIAWHDRNGDVLTVSEATTVGQTAAAAWVRRSVTGSPPAGARVGTPYAYAAGCSSGERVRFDRGFFGFGADTTYADGDSGSGWQWTGQKDNSISQDTAPGVEFMDSALGTLVRSAAWTVDRTYSAELVSTGTGDVRAWAYADHKTEGNRRRFRIKSGKTLTISVTVQSLEAQAVQLAIDQSVWNGWNWDAATTPRILGPVEEFTAGEIRRITFATEVEGDGTHCIPMARLRATGGGNVAVGRTVRLDKMFVGWDVDPDSDPDPYIDGEGFWMEWMGDPDASVSRRVGPAKRAMCEVVSAIDLSTMAGGTRAEFQVELNIPAVFWEDTKARTANHVIGRTGSVVELDQFDGTTAPINDAVITVWGPISPFTLTDVGSGASFSLDRRLADDEKVVIDNEHWTVEGKGGRSWMADVTHQGSTRLLPLTVEEDETSPRIRITAKSIGRRARIIATGKKRYFLA